MKPRAFPGLWIAVLYLAVIASVLAADHEGTFTIANLNVGGVLVQRASCNYSLDTLGEPLKNGVFRYEAPAKLHYSTKMFLTCQSLDSTHPERYYVAIDCPVGEPGEDPGSNIAAAPGWDRLFLTQRSYNCEQFLSADRAKSFWKQGFNVVDATLLADPSAAAAATSPPPERVATPDNRTSSRPNPFAEGVQTQPTPAPERSTGIMNEINLGNYNTAGNSGETSKPRSAVPAPNPFSRLSAPPANSHLNTQARAPEVRENPFKRAAAQATQNPLTAAASSGASEPRTSTAPAPEKSSAPKASGRENPVASAQRLAWEKAEQERRAEAEAYRERARQQHAQVGRSREQELAAFNAREQERRAEVKQKADRLADEFGRQREQINKTFDDSMKKTTDVFDQWSKSRNESSEREREMEAERRRQQEAETTRARPEYSDNQEQLREREREHAAEERREEERRQRAEAEREAEQRAAAWRDTIQRLEQQRDELRRQNGGNSGDDVEDVVRKFFPR